MTDTTNRDTLSQQQQPLGGEDCSRATITDAILFHRSKITRTPPNPTTPPQDAPPATPATQPAEAATTSTTDHDPEATKTTATREEGEIKDINGHDSVSGLNDNKDTNTTTTNANSQKMFYRYDRDQGWGKIKREREEEEEEETADNHHPKEEQKEMAQGDHDYQDEGRKDEEKTVQMEEDDEEDEEELRVEEEDEEDEEEEEARGEIVVSSSRSTTQKTTTQILPALASLSQHQQQIPFKMPPSASSAFSSFQNYQEKTRNILIKAQGAMADEQQHNNAHNNHYNTNNNNNNLPAHHKAAMIPLLPTPPGLPLPSAPVQQTQQLGNLPSSSSTSAIHNKDLWLEVSMHAHIVMNLAAMAQSQRLSTPPLDMIRSHINHIVQKVRELSAQYPSTTTTTSPSSSSPSSSASSSPSSSVHSSPPSSSLSPPSSTNGLLSVPPPASTSSSNSPNGGFPFSAPPAGWRRDSLEEYRPEVRPHSTISNALYSGLSPESSTPSPNGSWSSRNGSPVRRTSASLPGTPPTRDSPKDDVSDDVAALLSTSKLIAIGASRSNNSSPTHSGSANHHQFHHYTVGSSTTNQQSRSRSASSNQRTLKFSNHRIPSADSSDVAKPAFVATPADGSEPTNGRGAAKSSKKRKRPTPSCDQCHTMYTPEWRRGPRGAGTLCNACGLRYSRQEKRLKKREEHLQTKRKASIDAILNP